MKQMILKEEIKKHIVIPDTNILWFKDKIHVVNPEFDDFWDKNQESSNLHLLIPEVVKGELHFQQSTSAKKQMQKATECILEVSGITDHKYKHHITTKKIQSQVEKKFNKWAKKKKAVIAKVPIATINLDKIIQNSIWRKPPFELDAKNPKNEKGFRDAMILETIVDIVKNEKSDCLIAFICNDNLLRDTSAKQLKSYINISVFKSLDDFDSYLKLQHEKLTDKFIKSILRRASLRFYDPKNQNSLAIKERLPDKISEKFSDYLENPVLSEKSLLNEGLLASAQKWRPGVGGKFWISNSQFEKIEKRLTYHWLTEVTYAKVFVKNTGALATLLTEDIPKVLVVTFNIFWVSKVYKDGRFKDPKIIDIAIKENELLQMNEELKRTYSLEES